MYIPESTAWAIIVALITSIVMAITIIVLVRRLSKIKREKEDKPLVEHHKFSIKPPTWRFQKYHPNSCPHHHGIYRKEDMKVLEETIKKTIFVCADCVSCVEIDEIEQRDKFKK